MTKALPKFPKQCPECGAQFLVNESQIARGRGKHCSRSCAARHTRREHGHTTKSGQSPTYNSWATMRQRCTNPNHPKYALYGGRGITVTDEWASFDRFLKDMGQRPKGMTLDRIDNDGPYSPENCRWATVRQQQNNQARTTMVQYGGEQLPLGDLALRLGINKQTLNYRIRGGWSESRWGDKPWGGNHP